jgi:hypothetical protein
MRGSSIGGLAKASATCVGVFAASVALVGAITDAETAPAKSRLAPSGVVRVGEYMQETKLFRCKPDQPLCTVDFSPVPTNADFIVTSISCRAVTRRNGFVFVILAGKSADGSPTQNTTWLQAQLSTNLNVNSEPETRLYQVNNEVLHLYHGGEIPSGVIGDARTIISGSAAYQLPNGCTIAGTLRTP